jgi:hypothetical protein
LGVGFDRRPPLYIGKARQLGSLLLLVDGLLLLLG